MAKFEGKNSFKERRENMASNPEAINNSASEIWFRPEDQALLQKKQIFTTVRLGDRRDGLCENKGCYIPGSFVTVKILKDKDRNHFSGWETEIVIINNEIKTMAELEDSDLKFGPPSQREKIDLLKKISEFYGREISEKEVISIIHFEYLENLKSMADLISAKVLTYAKLPPANPEHLDFEKLIVPLIEHDYPAKTAIMWNSAYQEFGIKAGNVMLVGNPAYSQQILQVLRQDPKYLGGGAGVGFKDEAIKYLDELDPLAKAIGSINFILKTPEGKLKGFNTDGLGYALSLADRFKARGHELKGKKAVILGAGGTGNAIAFALANEGMKLVILNRTVQKAENLCQGINECYQLVANQQVRFGGEDQIAKEVQDADVVINVSTKGATGEMERYNTLAPANLPATAENIQANLMQAEEVLRTIPQKAIISDIVLTKEPTPFLKSAQKAGFETLDGIPMVVNQGVEAFWLLHGKELQQKNIAKEQVAQIMKKAAGL
jgi:shikimate dehydrogenase